MKMDYPKFQNFWSNADNEANEEIKCPQCGKEVSENNNCICPYCGARLKDVINRKCTTMVQSLISGWVETKYQDEHIHLSDEDWNSRLTIFKVTSSLIADYGDELQAWAEKECEPYKAKIEKFRNNFWIKILDFISLLFNGEPAYLIVLGLLFIVFFFIFKGIFSAVLALLGVSFIMAYIMAVVLAKQSEKPCYIKNWFTSKNEILQALKNYFIEEKYLEQDLLSSIPEFAKDMGVDEDLKRAKESNDQNYIKERSDWWTMVMKHVGWLLDMAALIGYDYRMQVLSKTEKDLPSDSRRQINDRKKHWDQYYEQYEV